MWWFLRKRVSLRALGSASSWRNAFIVRNTHTTQTNTYKQTNTHTHTHTHTHTYTFISYLHILLIYVHTCAHARLITSNLYLQSADTRSCVHGYVTYFHQRPGAWVEYRTNDGLASILRMLSGTSEITRGLITIQARDNTSMHMTAAPFPLQGSMSFINSVCKL